MLGGLGLNSGTPYLLTDILKKTGNSAISYRKFVFSVDKIK